MATEFAFGIAIPTPESDIDHAAAAAENLAADFLIFSELTSERAGLTPTSVAAFLAPRSTIGLVAEVDVSYAEPFPSSRTLATLDHLTAGRAGWQLKVDRKDEAAHKRGWSTALPPDELTDRVIEFVDVVRGLWDSWDNDAVVRDKATGIFIRADRVHHLDHTGRYFSVRGPSLLPRPRQGHLPTFVTLADDMDSRRLAKAAGEVIRLRANSADQVRVARREFAGARILVDIPFTSLTARTALLDEISGVAHGIVVVGLAPENLGDATLDVFARELSKRGLRDCANRSGDLRERLGLTAAVSRFVAKELA